jgi:hypothetical protein
MHTCMCGCGKQLPKTTSNGRARHFWRGHGTSSKVMVNCAHCGKICYVHQWRIDIFPKVFCSRQCSSKSRIHFVELRCSICDKQIIRKPFRPIGKNVYCSLQCLSIGRYAAPNTKVSVPCDWCGTILSIFPSKRKIGAHFFCNIQCRKFFITGRNNPSYTTGNGRRPDYGPNWKSQRRKALERDEHHCQYCNSSKLKSRFLHVHHINKAYVLSKEWEKANALSNLITLCKNCHPLAERGLIDLPTLID